MLKVKQIIPPSLNQWEAVIKGMRLPFKSGHLGDSGIDHWTREYKLGENDRKLLMGLCGKGEASERKVLRQLPVTIEIQAPLYWWKQADQYKVGTVTNSESSMHTLTKYNFTAEDFSLGNLGNTDYYIESGHLGVELNDYISLMLETLNSLKDKYSETNDDKYWDALNKLLPQSYNQTRMWSGNYENCVAMISDRIDHKLPEWRDLIIAMLRDLPLLSDIMVTMGVISIEDGFVRYKIKKTGEICDLCPSMDIIPAAKMEEWIGLPN